MYLCALVETQASGTGSYFEINRFNGDTGEYIDRVQDNQLGVYEGWNVVASYEGTIYVSQTYGGNTWVFGFDPSSWTSGPQILRASDFGLGLFNTMAQFSLQSDILLNPTSNTMVAYQISTKKAVYSQVFPYAIVGCYMIDDHSCWVLCQNSVLVLFDYLRQIVLGAYYLPPPSGGFWATTVWLYYYSERGWLLVSEQQPNAPSGASQTNITGYLIYPSAVRLSTPIPLVTPVEGETIPVMTQLVDSLNHGVSGAVVKFKSRLAVVVEGVGLTDNKGRAYLQLNCNASGEAAIDCTAVTVDQTGEGVTF
jgi:hypothetical protein